MTYKQGIVDAIQERGDRSGSSSIAVRKVMQSKLPRDKKWLNATYFAALKTGVANGEFIQNKNSYKLSAEYKKKLTKSSSSTKPTKKKATPTKKKTVKKAASSKKKTMKKPSRRVVPRKRLPPRKSQLPPRERKRPPQSKTKE